jgi:hypothetical protein
MTEASDVERAERIGRRRAWLFAFQGVMFIAWQGLFFSGLAAETSHSIDRVKVSTWLVWTVLLLILLATGGRLISNRLSPQIRALLEDELTRSHRTKAYVFGFWAAVLSAVGLEIFAMFQPVREVEAVHIILSAAIGVAFITFAALEQHSRMFR